MKKAAAIGLLTLMLGVGIGGTASASAAASSIHVVINGQTQNYDQPPVIVNGRTLVPLRGIFEALGATIDWNNTTRTVTAVKGSTTITLQIGSKSAVKNGQNVTLDAEAQLINGRTMVPVRFVGEALGADVQWLNSTSTVDIKMAESPKVMSTEEIGRFSDRVVLIEVMNEKGEVTGSGSGFVVSSTGEILTNEHVIFGASSAKITFADKKSYTTTTLLNTDVDNDLALLKIDATNLPAVTFGDSSKIKLGQSIVAIGSPLGLQNTLSTGVISTTSRKVVDTEYIQISAPIDHGSSGGALFNMYGEVIGVTSSGWDGTANIGLAIPSNAVKQFLQQPHKQTKMAPPVRENLTHEQILNELNSKWVSHINPDLDFKLVLSPSNDGSEPPAFIMLLQSEDDYKWLMEQDEKEHGLVVPLVLDDLAGELYLKGVDEPIIAIGIDKHTTANPDLIAIAMFDYENETLFIQRDPNNDGPEMMLPLGLPRR